MRYPVHVVSKARRQFNVINKKVLFVYKEWDDNVWMKIEFLSASCPCMEIAISVWKALSCVEWYWYWDRWLRKLVNFLHLSHSFSSGRCSDSAGMSEWVSGWVVQGRRHTESHVMALLCRCTKARN